MRPARVRLSSAVGVTSHVQPGVARMCPATRSEASGIGRTAAIRLGVGVLPAGISPTAWVGEAGRVGGDSFTARWTARAGR